MKSVEVLRRETDTWVKASNLSLSYSLLTHELLTVSRIYDHNRTAHEGVRLTLSCSC